MRLGINGRDLKLEWLTPRLGGGDRRSEQQQGDDGKEGKFFHRSINAGRSFDASFRLSVTIFLERTRRQEENDAKRKRSNIRE